MPLTGKQRRHLRALGHDLAPIAQVGKGGVSDAVIAAVDQALTDHELVKIRLLESVEVPRDDAAALLAARTGAEITPAMAQIRARLQGVVFAQQYMMLDYDCPKELLESVSAITPGIESPTVSPMADPAWVAVRSMVPRRRVNAIMDELAAAGAKAIIATDIRSCRMG